MKILQVIENQNICIRVTVICAILRVHHCVTYTDPIAYHHHAERKYIEELVNDNKYKPDQCRYGK